VKFPHLLDPRPLLRRTAARLRDGAPKKINLALQGGGAHGAFHLGGARPDP
jgi:predicted acylesterase/phospholipase RssA